MIKMDVEWLAGLGMPEDLPADELALVLRFAYQTLELRVGTALVARMTDAQLDAFNVFIDARDDARASEWLSANFPGYRDVVHDNLRQLEEQLRRTLPAIVNEIRMRLAMSGS
jgi:Protein of unknown function (DUF5663)